MSVFLAPTFGVGYQGMTLNGSLLSGGQIYTYQAGSSTLQPTYTTNAGTIQNANPIILDASGKPPSEIWMTSGQAYKFVLMDSLSNVIATYDNVSGINDVTSTSAFSEWVATGLIPTYSSATQFTVPGNQTTVLQVNRRVQITCSAGVIYGYISISAYTSLTTVTVVMDSTPLDSGISIVNVAFLSGTNQSVPYNISHAVTAGDLTGTPTFFSPITNSLGANVALNNASNYFDGPSIAQGTSGKWFVSGTVVVSNGDSGSSSALISVKLWDGTTVISSTAVYGLYLSGGVPVSLSLSGFISSPTGNLRISVKSGATTNNFMLYNLSGNSKDCTLTAIRIG